MNETAISDVLILLQDVLGELPHAGVARCADYALFPLLAIVKAQGTHAHGTQQLAQGAQKYFGERNRERALQCIQAILLKAKITSVEQFLELLQVFVTTLQPGTILFPFFVAII